jgi:hypothetical protein
MSITYPDNKTSVSNSAAQDNTPFVFPKGDYTYSIKSIDFKTYSTGTQGIEIELEGYYQSGKTFRCFDRVFLTENAMWKLDQLLGGLGVSKRPENELELHSLIGREGSAIMGPNDDGYPKVLRYAEASMPEDRWAEVGPPPMETSDDAPF